MLNITAFALVRTIVFIIEKAMCNDKPKTQSGKQGVPKGNFFFGTRVHCMKDIVRLVLSRLESDSVIYCY